MLTSRHALERKKNTTVVVIAGGEGFSCNNCVKVVFLLGCYGCIFHGTGNSAMLCQNFGISGGLNTPNPLPLGTPVGTQDTQNKLCCISTNLFCVVSVPLEKQIYWCVLEACTRIRNGNIWTDVDQKLKIKCCDYAGNTSTSITKSSDTNHYHNLQKPLELTSLNCSAPFT